MDNHDISDQCGVSSEYLCTGDPSTACGGFDAISVYQRTPYSSVGCFQDNLVSRIMKLKAAAQVMSGEVCGNGYRGYRETLRRSLLLS